MKPDMWLSKLKTAAGILHGSRSFGGPYQLNLDLTNRCNIRCVHCYFYSPFLQRPLLRNLKSALAAGRPAPSAEELDKIQHVDMDEEMARRVVRRAMDMGTRRFQFSGCGECFLHPSALEVMEIVKRGGARCVANTNGTLLGRGVADRLIEMGFDELRVTAMAGTPEGYVQTHPGASTHLFDQLTGNLLYFRDRKQALGARHPKITLAAIVVAQNAEGLVDFARFADRVGADKVLYKPFDDCRDPGLGHVAPSETQAETIRRQVGEARLILDGRGIRHNIDSFLSVFGRTIDTADLYRSIPCYYGWLASMVDADGEVYSCCRNNRSMGNVYKLDFADIWHGAAYREFRRQAKRLPERDTPVENCDCRRCVHHAANIQAQWALHPVASRRKGLRRYLDRGFGDSE